MKLPSQEQCSIAMNRLRCRQGDNKTDQACMDVAMWIDYRCLEAYLRNEARTRGITIKQMRQERVKELRAHWSAKSASKV